METERECLSCGKVKPIDRFYKNTRSKGGRLARCDVCARAGTTKEYKRDYQYKYKYGLTADEYDAMVFEQESKCAICGDESKLVVDHCHDKGHVRKLLCQSCNKGLGLFYDNPEWLEAAADYLRGKYGG